MTKTTKNSKLINADPEKIYKAFTEQEALEIWLVPGKMTGKIHDFNLKVGGGYTMSLYYPESEKEMKGKTSDKEDRYTAKFLELIPSKKIIQSSIFDTKDPDFKGEMIMEVFLEKKDKATEVTVIFKNLPRGINPKDNETGTNSSLEKLAHYVTAKN